MTFSMARSDFGWERSNWERSDHGAKGPDTAEREREYR